MQAAAADVLQPLLLAKCGLPAPRHNVSNPTNDDYGICCHGSLQPIRKGDQT